MINKHDKEILALASSDWSSFKAIIGEPAIKKALIVVLRKQGLSYGQIAVRLKVSRQYAHSIYLEWHNTTVNTQIDRTA